MIRQKKMPNDFKKKIIELKEQFSTKEDADIGADFILNIYTEINADFKNIKEKISAHQ